MSILQESCQESGQNPGSKNPQDHIWESCKIPVIIILGRSCMRFLLGQPCVVVSMLPLLLSINLKLITVLEYSNTKQPSKLPKLTKVHVRSHGSNVHDVIISHVIALEWIGMFEGPAGFRYEVSELSSDDLLLCVLHHASCKT